MQLKQNNDGTINVTAPVMIPGAKDCDYKNGEPPLTSEQIREFAKSYEKYQFIDHEHGLTRNGNRIGVPIRSFILTNDTNVTLHDGTSKTYPSGTWLVTSQLTDPKAIQTAMNGGYSGYSASVFTQSRADKYLNALKSNKDEPLPCACKNINSMGNSLIKDVPDPVVLSVSLVNTPCLHDSQFCELNNNNGEIMEEDVKSLKSKVLSAMGMSEEAEVVALKSEVVELKSTITEMKAEFDEALKSMQDEFKVTLETALKPVEEEAMKSEEEEPEVEEAVETTEEEEVETETKEDVEEVVEEPTAEKGESKAEPIHDAVAEKSTKKFNIYEYMGRNANGTRKH